MTTQDRLLIITIAALVCATAMLGLHDLTSTQWLAVFGATAGSSGVLHYFTSATSPGG